MKNMNKNNNERYSIPKEQLRNKSSWLDAILGRVRTDKPDNYYENLNSEPITALESVFQYLNLPDYKIKNIQHQKQKKYVPMNSQTRKILIEFFKPHNERLFKFIGKKFDWDE